MGPFEILGLPDNADIEMVNRRWKELALVHHPDVGGDSEKFQELREAYVEAREIASDLPCEECNGTGSVKRGTGFTFMKLPCPSCGGTGERKPTNGNDSNEE